MRDWFIILLIAVLSGAVGLWAVRRRPSSGTGSAEPVKSPSSPIAGGRSRPTQSGVPTSPGPTLAILEFEGGYGRVAVQRPEVTIGRHSSDDIRVSDIRVSRHHARLVAKRGGGFEIHNLTAVRSEPNPMLVNGETREHADIFADDMITLGGVNFVFRPVV